MHNNAKKVEDIVVCLLSIERDSNFTLRTSNGLDDRLLVLYKLIYYPAARYVMWLRYQFLDPGVLEAQKIL